MIRQNLNPDSAYADIAVRGNGLTSVQFRPAASAATQEIRSTVNAPTQIRIERRGNQFTIFAAKSGEARTPAGPATITLPDPLYIRIGMCPFDANILDSDGREWLSARQAFLVKSASITGPMGSRGSSSPVLGGGASV